MCIECSAWSLSLTSKVSVLKPEAAAWFNHRSTIIGWISVKRPTLDSGIWNLQPVVGGPMLCKIRWQIGTDKEQRHCLSYAHALNKQAVVYWQLLCMSCVCAVLSFSEQRTCRACMFLYACTLDNSSLAARGKGLRLIFFTFIASHC